MLGRPSTSSSIKKKKRRHHHRLLALLRFLFGMAIIFLVFESILNSVTMTTTTTIPLSSSSSAIASIIIDQPFNNNNNSRSSSEMEVRNNNSNNNNNNNNSNVIILAAGWGTTGTHLLFKATCYLGYRSVHWNLGCLPSPSTNKTTTTSSKNNNNNNNNNTNKNNIDVVSHHNIKKIMRPNEIKPRFHTHSKLRNIVTKLSKCLQLQIKNNNNKCGNAIEWQAKVNNLIDQLVQDIGGNNGANNIQAFHDIPYPYFINSFIQAAYKYQKEPILLLSERNPIEWIKRRIDTGHFETDFMCKFELFEQQQQEQQQQPTFISSSNRMMEQLKGPIPSILSGGRLDLLGCISHATTTKSVLSAGEEADANNTYLSMNDYPSPDTLDLNDVFISLKNFLIENNNSITTTTMVDDGNNNDDGDDDGIQTVIKEFVSYQDKIRKYADFSYNLFEQYDKKDGHKLKTSVQTLASEIENQVPLLRRNTNSKQQQQQQQPIIYVNLVKGTVLDEQNPIF